MKSRNPRLVTFLICLLISAATGSALAAASAQTSPPSAPSDADIFRSRSFQEPLVPVGDTTTPAENAALNDAIESYTKRTDGDDLSAITSFIERHPKSPWRAALLVNLGLAYRQSGWFLKALAAWEQAWELSKGATELRAKALADRALGELAELNTRIGRLDEVGALLKQIEDRPLMGSATEKVTAAREGSWLMRKEPGKAFRCGVAALSSIYAVENPGKPHPAELSRVQSTKRGLSLRQLKQLAAELKMDYVAAKRNPGAKVIVPSVVNWKAEHYAAVVREENGRFLTRDPSGGEIWVSRAALDAESSGYFLIQRSKLPSGWQMASAKEASQVWGRGPTAGHDESGTKVNDPKARDQECSSNGLGMAVYNFHLQTVSLNITDTPVGYIPPVGPSMLFTATYNQREADQPANFDYSNLGPKWTFNWLSYVQDNSNNLSADVKLYPAGGGMEEYRFDSVTGSFKPELQSGAILQRVSSNPIVYERISSDGSRERFAESDGNSGTRRVFLKRRIDSAGNYAELVYDDLRLTEIHDALGQPPITLEYDDPCDAYRITKVTDPFKRFATFTYTDCKLTSITDTIGIVSQFDYKDKQKPDFVTTLTTPYRSVSFTQPVSNHPDGQGRVLVARDPLTEERERVEYAHNAPGIPGCTPAPNCGVDPDAPNIGVDYPNAFHNYRNSFYWDKKAMATAPPDDEDPDYTKARLTQFVHTFEQTRASNIKEREKQPLEKPVYYFYPNPGAAPWLQGGSGLPSIVAQKILPDGTSRVTRFERNAAGRVTKATDPEGRVTHYVYAANQIDLIYVYQKNPKGYSQYPGNEPADLTFHATYNGSHQPLIVWDAAGQTTTYTYTTGFKQIETVTNARNETTTYGYGDGSTGHPVGYLTSITSPEVNGAAASTTFYYDELRRVHKVTSNPDGYMVTIEYDDLDRPTQITYPDNTTEEFQYTDSVRGMTLDLTASKDRLDRWTYRHYNADRNMDSIADALTLTSYDWCSCGSLNSITDPNGNTTTFNRDLQGRVYQKVFQDNRTINYLFEGQTTPDTPGATSRLKSATDALNRRTNYTYFRDNNIQQVSYTDTAGNPLTPATPTVSYTYDPNYDRIEKMIEDGTIETAYSYYYIGTPPFMNSGKLQSIDGPLGDDTVTFTYDELGRITSQTIEGGEESTVAYDALGRLTTSVNALGEFGRTYFGPTPRLDTLTYPNGQTTHHAYFGNGKDRRLQTLENLDAQTMTLSKFDYDYDEEGQILSWARQFGTANSGRWFAYDEIRRLLSARNHSSPTSATEVSSYVYDDAGNRTGDSTVNPQGPAGNGLSHSYTPNNLNQIESFATQQGPFSGADVFLTYDLDGNLIDGGEGKTFEWDAANRLRAIDHGSGQRSEFSYDGLSRRVKIVEKTGSTVTSTKHFVWVGKTIAQERSGVNKVTRQYFEEGEKRGEKSHYYTRDHLGSIRELTDGEGALMTQYDYDPYGQRTKLAGTEDVDFGYTGHYHHAPSGLNLTLYRAYNPAFGRWLSRDPIGEVGGLHLYGYVRNDPVNYWDPTGENPALGAVIGLGLGGPVGAVIGAGIGTGIVLIGGAAAIDWWRNRPPPPPQWDIRSRGHSDPIQVPDVDVGRDPNDPSKCNPCPKPPAPWKAPGDAHGSTCGEHWHWIEYHQNPVTCRCHSKRMSGALPP